MAVTYGPGVSGGGNEPNPDARIRFDAIGEAWTLVKAQMGTWVLLTLVYLVAAFAISSVVRFLLGTVGLSTSPAPGELLHFGPMFFLAFATSTVVNAAFGAFFQGGMYNVALKQARGEAVSIGDLFGAGDVIGALVVGVLLYTFAVNIGLILLIIPGLLISGALMFTVPLIVEKKLSAIQALTLSWNTLKGQALAAFGFVFCSSLLSALGMLACGVGILFTVPIYYLSIAIAYRDYFGQPIEEPRSQIQMPFPSRDPYAPDGNSGR